jgi:hypothetical protein
MIAGRRFIYICGSKLIMKNKKNLILTIILSLVAVIILIGAIIILNDSYKPEVDGQIQVELIDLNGNVVLEKTIEFQEGNTLKYLIEQNFSNVVIEDGMLMSIESFKTASDWSTFIMIYVDNEESMFGLLDIEFTNGTLISFKMTEYIYS